MMIPNFTEDERRALLSALRPLKPAKLEYLLFDKLGDSITLFGSIDEGIEVLSVKFIRWIALHPAKLKTFLDAFVLEYDALPEVPVLRAHSARLQHLAQLAAVDPVDACLIDAVVMVNRGRLRAILRNLVNGATRPLVVVAGQRQSGRSHSLHLIRHVASAHNIPTKRFDLDAWVVEERTLDRLFDRIVADLALAQAQRPSSIGAQPETQGARYADEIADCLERRAPGAGQCWLVFDSLDRQMAHEIAAFIRRLCEKRLRADFRDCTIFLLGESAQLVIEQGLLVDREDLGMGSLIDTEIAEAAASINAMGAQPLDDAGLHHRVATMVHTMSNETPDRALDMLSRKLTALRMEVGAP